MGNQQFQEKGRENQRQKTEQANKYRRQNLCGRCGAAYDDSDLFCPECGESLGERKCPNCGADINATCEICPSCRKPVDGNHCSFCGAEFEGDEPFCSECGSPRAGITCAKCGTLNFRSFCSKCNSPLNDNAMVALEQARRDPKFQRACKLREEMAELENYLYDLKEEIERAIAEEEAESSAPDAPGLSAEGQRLQAQYAELMKILGNQPVSRPQPQQQTEEKPSVKKKREIKLKFANAEKMMEAYKAKSEEMNALLSSMLPDANSTPAQQRDFMCARKVPVVTTAKVQEPTSWECNFCHFLHREPNECCEPWRGGTWHYKTVTVETKVWQYLN